MGRVGSGINFHVLGNLGWVRCKNFGLDWVSKKRSMSNSGAGIERYKSAVIVLDFLYCAKARQQIGNICGLPVIYFRRRIKD